MSLGGAKDEHFSCFYSSCQLGFNDWLNQLVSFRTFRDFLFLKQITGRELLFGSTIHTTGFSLKNVLWEMSANAKITYFGLFSTHSFTNSNLRSTRLMEAKIYFPNWSHWKLIQHPLYIVKKKPKFWGILALKLKVR